MKALLCAAIGAVLAAGALEAQEAEKNANKQTSGPVQAAKQLQISYKALLYKIKQMEVPGAELKGEGDER